MRFLDWIIQYLWEIGEWFWEAYKEVRDWVWPFYYLADPLYEIQRIFGWLSWEFESFSEWAYDVAGKIGSILDFGDIWSYFRTWFEYAEDAWYWVRYAFSNVTNIIDTWWSSVRLTVLAWIDIATEGLDSLKVAWSDFWTITFPDFLSYFDGLKVAWDNFWTVTFPSLVSFDWLGIWWDSKLKDIDSLIDSTLKVWFPFYDSLVELWNSIAEFFTDPLEWLLTRFTDWFLGPEE